MSGPSRFDGALTTYENAALVQRSVVDALSKALFACAQDAPRQFKNVFEFGCGTGMLTRALLAHTTPQTLWLNDASPAMLAHCCDQIERKVNVRRLLGNAETLAWPQEMDLIASSSTVQWFAEPLGVVAKAEKALRSGGMLALTGFLPGTLEEVTSLTGVGLRYPSAQDWQRVLTRRMQLCAFTELPQTLVFDSPRDVLEHLRSTGVNGIARRFAWTRRTLQAFCDDYCRLFEVDGDRVRLTYRPWMAVARKHMSNAAINDTTNAA